MRWEPSAFRSDKLYLTWRDIFSLIFQGFVKQDGVAIEIFRSK